MKATGVAKHLDHCVRCQQEYHSFLYAYRLVHRAPEMKLNPLLWQGIYSKISGLPLSQQNYFSDLRSFLTTRWVSLGALAGTLVVVLSLSIFFLPYRQNVAAEQALRSYIQERERTEVEHLRAFKNKQRTGVHEIYFNPFSLDDRESRDQRNPFSRE